MSLPPDDPLRKMVEDALKGVYPIQRIPLPSTINDRHRHIAWNKDKFAERQAAVAKEARGLLDLLTAQPCGGEQVQGIGGDLVGGDGGAAHEADVLQGGGLESRADPVSGLVAPNP